MISISHESKMILLRFPYDENLIDLIKDTCSNRRWLPDKKAWAIGLTDLQTMLIPALDEKDITYSFEDSYKKLFSPEEYEPSIKDFNTKTPLYPYQIIGANKLVDNNRFCLFDAIGLGKSAEVIAALNHLKLKNVLLIVPNSIKKQWLIEINKFTDLQAVIIDGPWVKRKDLWSQQGIKIVNYEKIRCKNDLAYLRTLIFDCMVLDEASRIKSSQTQTFNSINSLNSVRKWVLTGTPIENCVKDLYSIYKFVEPSLFGSWYSFKNNFLVTDTNWFGGNEVEVIVGYKNLELLKQTIKSTSIRRTKKEVEMDLPPISRETLWIDLSKKEEEWYNRIQGIIDEKMQWIKDGKSASILGELQLLRSLCNGEICLQKSSTQNKEILKWIHEVGDTSTKIDMAENLLLDLTKDNGSKIIVFSDFLVPLASLKERLDKRDIKTAELSGAVSNREEQIEKFKTESDTNILLCQIKTGGYGLNLQEASAIVFLNRHYNPSVEEQAIGRVYRQGQDKKVQIFYILVSDSREEEINKIIRQKMGVFKEVLEEDTKTYI